jgi:hypothetical protein
VVNDAEAGASNPDGNACPITGGGTTSVTCTGVPGTGAPFTGAAMVSMLGTNLSSLNVSMNNYEAISFGILGPS